jgi:sugar diacid utilization regulator
VTSLVRAALGDDLDELLEAAADELHQPLGLVSPAAEALGCAPADDGGRRALAVAEAAARARLAAPPGWRVVRVERGAAPLGFLAVGGDAPGPLLEIVSGLLAEQILRIQLVRAHHADFVRRLVHEPFPDVRELRREASALGLRLAGAYWVALLAWRDTPPQGRVADVVPARGNGALTVDLGGRVVLLQAAEGREPPEWFEHAVAHARRVAPAAAAQAIVARGPASLAGLSAAVAELEALWRLGARAEDEPLLRAEQFALDRLLLTVARGREARAFVQDLLGPLLEWDARHRGDLVRVLEAGLDHPRHDHAASRCFMHRNTFRHRWRQATEILGHDLTDPDLRLALHVALKLRKVLPAP